MPTAQNKQRKDSGMSTAEMIDHDKMGRAIKKLAVNDTTPLEDVCDLVTHIFAHGVLHI